MDRFNILLLLVLFSVVMPFMSPSYGQGPTNNTLVDNSQDNSNAARADNSQDRSEKETRNEGIVMEFIFNVFIAKNASAAVNYLEEDYIQHNPMVPTGREAFINAFAQIFEENPNFNSQVQRTYTDGDYVIVHSFSPYPDNGRAIVDIYRVNENGKIAEHWDIIQPIPINPANNNTMFYLK
jgi:predicted SnoaL-like aldol condensation-catalyzing enzyme